MGLQPEDCEWMGEGGYAEGLVQLPSATARYGRIHGVGETLLICKDDAN